MMKKVLIWALVLSTLSVTAQQRGRFQHGSDRQGKMAMMEDLSPEQAATLKTKRMTLDLNLTESQQDKMYAIHLKNAKNRQERMAEVDKQREEGTWTKPSKEERFNLINEKLDKKIAHKKELKQILDKEQFERWETHARRAHKSKDMKRRRSNRSRR